LSLISFAAADQQAYRGEETPREDQLLSWWAERTLTSKRQQTRGYYRSCS